MDQRPFSIQNYIDLMTREFRRGCLTIVFLFLFFLTAAILYYKHNINLHRIYSMIEYKDSIFGSIKDIMTLKSTSFIVIDSSKIILRSSNNFMYDEEDMSEHLRPGVFLIKNSYSDTILVLNNRDTLVFIHGNTINQNN